MFRKMQEISVLDVIGRCNKIVTIEN